MNNIISLGDGLCLIYLWLPGSKHKTQHILDSQYICVESSLTKWRRVVDFIFAETWLAYQLNCSTAYCLWMNLRKTGITNSQLVIFKLVIRLSTHRAVVRMNCDDSSKMKSLQSDFIEGLLCNKYGPWCDVPNSFLKMLDKRFYLIFNNTIKYILLLPNFTN